ncbi:MAG: M48 family metallopeptidase [Planctomycetes bacterium]|nr:M48 family metallopeptidase [Planctomycetota bacterium]
MEPTPPLGEDDWSALLERALEAPVRVRFSRARHQVVRLARHRGTYHISLARFFSLAPPEIRHALAMWMRSGRRARKACAALDGWIDAHVRALAHEKPAHVRLEPRGSHHDLAALAQGVIAQHFAQEELRAWPSVGWGRKNGSRSRRTLRLGSFDPVDRVVRLHPALDSADVPMWFVRYVLFHELLHAVLDRPERSKGRRVIHGREFVARERAYPDFERALAWEREHVLGLIRAARSGRAFALPTRAAQRPAARPTPTPADDRSVQGLLF